MVVTTGTARSVSISVSIIACPVGAISREKVMMSYALDKLQLVMGGRCV